MPQQLVEGPGHAETSCPLQGSGTLTAYLPLTEQQFLHEHQHPEGLETTLSTRSCLEFLIQQMLGGTLLEKLRTTLSLK